MMQSGIFTGYFPYGLEEAARRIRGHGFNTVQLDLTFTDIDLSTLTPQTCKRVRDTFRAHDLPVCAVSGYTNFIHPDREQRRANIDRLKEILRNARALGSPYVISETGTYNLQSEWMADPENKTEEAFDTCRAAISDLCQVACDHGAMFLLETYVNNVVGSVEETVRMFAQVDHASLGLLMDPTNYFEAHNIGSMDDVLNQVFDTLAPHIRIAHAKDVARSGADKSEKHAFIGDAEALARLSYRGVGEIVLNAPGTGVLNYDLYLRRLSDLHPNIPVIIEHLEEPDVRRAKTFLDGKFVECGV